MIRSGWLGRVPDPLAEQILAAGTWRTFAAADREIVSGLGAEERSLWGIDSGCIRMHVAFNEAEPQFCHVAGPGSWFGELAFVTDLPRAFEMEAASACRLLRVGRKEVERIAATRPEIWYEIAEACSLFRTVTATALAHFVASGAIRTEYRRISVLKPQLLEDVLRRNA